MKKRELTTFAIKTIASCALLTGTAGTFCIASGQTKLKWAHVYETSEPFHRWSVWAGDEIEKRTNGRYELQVFPASSLGKEADIAEIEEAYAGMRRAVMDYGDYVTSDRRFHQGLPGVHQPVSPLKAA